jgi:hypothetical protein
MANAPDSRTNIVIIAGNRLLGFARAQSRLGTSGLIEVIP